jgi:hypothetical protein
VEAPQWHLRRFQDALRLTVTPPEDRSVLEKSAVTTVVARNAEARDVSPSLRTQIVGDGVVRVKDGGVLTGLEGIYLALETYSSQVNWSRWLGVTFRRAATRGLRLVSTSCVWLISRTAHLSGEP